MDIHAPHEPVHTWRDFFTHLVIVTIGLFIALMLEALVEYIHHRHIVHQARENIRIELEANHKSAQEDVTYLTTNMKNIESNIRTLQLLRKSHDVHGSLTNSMVFSNFDEAAWLTARETGALAYVPYNEVQTYADIYGDQALVNKKAQDVADNEFRALAPTLTGDDMGHLSPEVYQSMLQTNATVLIDLCTLRQYVQQLDNRYAGQLGLPAVKQTDCANLMH